jgi:hypothetical protein
LKAGEPTRRSDTSLGPHSVPTATPGHHRRDLSDLAGTRIGLVWDSPFEGDLVYDAIAADLEERYEHVGLVCHEVFGDIHGQAGRRCSRRGPLARDERVDASGA